MKHKLIRHLFTQHLKMAWAAAACLLIGNSAAEAAVVMTMSESGGNVTLAASGTLNTVGLSPIGNGYASGYENPSNGSLTTGSALTPINMFTSILGPSYFGPGNNGLQATSGSGDPFGVWAQSSILVVPPSYVSGAPLSGASTWSGQTFATMGLTPGTYVYSWGAGANADTLTVNIGAAVPEPSSALLGLVGALSLLRRPRR